MTIGKVTTTNFESLSKVREETAWLREMNAKASEILEIAQQSQRDLRDISSQIDKISDSMDEHFRSNELMDRHVAESPRVKFCDRNCRGEGTTRKLPKKPIEKTWVQKMFDLLKKFLRFFF